MESSCKKPMIGVAEFSATKHSTVGSPPLASTDEDMIDALRNSSGVAIPDGLMYLSMFEPRAKDFQILRGTELQHSITVIVCVR